MKSILPILIAVMLVFSGNLIAQTGTPPECLNLEEIQQKIGFPLEAKTAGAYGKVIAKVTVGANGKVEKAEIMESPSPVLSEAVMKYINELKFKAAKKEGKAIKSIVHVPIVFEMASTPKVYTSLDEALTTLNIVESLDLSGQKLASLDKRVARLKSLRKIVLDDNQFTKMPAVLKKFPSLEEIEIADNKLTKVPCFVKHMKNLRALDITGNEINKKKLVKL